MIKVKVIDSVDQDKIGVFVFHRNLIYVGNEHLCDLFLNDSQLISNHLIIEIIDGKLLAHPHKEIDFFLVNGKRSTGAKIIGLGQSIKIGSSTFIIEEFIEVPINHYKETLNQITEKLIQDNSPLLEIIGELQESEL